MYEGFCNSGRILSGVMLCEGSYRLTQLPYNVSSVLDDLAQCFGQQGARRKQ